MFVCVCNAITEEQVRDAIDAGADTRAVVTKVCSAGGDCGACHPIIEEMIEDRANLISASRLKRRPSRAA